MVFSSSFENPSIEPGQLFRRRHTGRLELQGDWNLITGTAITTFSRHLANGSGYSNPDAPDGWQGLAIEGNGTAWQDITFTEAGKYTINFLAAYTSDIRRRWVLRQ